MQSLWKTCPHLISLLTTSSFSNSIKQMEHISSTLLPLPLLQYLSRSSNLLVDRYAAIWELSSAWYLRKMKLSILRMPLFSSSNDIITQMKKAMTAVEILDSECTKQIMLCACCNSATFSLVTDLKFRFCLRLITSYENERKMEDVVHYIQQAGLRVKPFYISD